MSKSTIAVFCALVATGPLALSQSSESTQGLPPGHPPVTTAPAAPGAATPAAGSLPPGHPPVTPGPSRPSPANALPPGHPPLPGPAKTASVPPLRHPEAAAIRGLIRDYYDSISGPPGVARNWERFQSLFAADARLVTVAGDGAAPLVLTPERFIAMNRNYFEAGGYSERSIHERIDAFGHVAHVWSTYEARRGAGTAPYSRGINSFQLVGAAGRWWITGVAWDRERAGAPLPSDYLPARQ